MPTSCSRFLMRRFRNWKDQPLPNRRRQWRRRDGSPACPSPSQVGRLRPQRAVLQRGMCGGALNNIGEKLVFLRRFSGDTEQIAQTDDKGGRVSRSVWSAWSLLPLSDVWRGSKAGASSTHSIRFARFGGRGDDGGRPDGQPSGDREIHRVSSNSSVVGEEAGSYGKPAFPVGTVSNY